MTEEEEGTEEEEEEMYMREAGQRGDEYVPPACQYVTCTHTYWQGVPQLSSTVALKDSEPTAILYITVITPHPIGLTLSQLRNP